MPFLVYSCIPDHEPAVMGLWQSFSLRSVYYLVFSFSLCEVLSYHLQLLSIYCLQRWETVWLGIIFLFCIILYVCTIPNWFALDPRIRSFSFPHLSVQVQCQKQMHIVLIQLLGVEAWSEQEFLFSASTSFVPAISSWLSIQIPETPRTAGASRSAKLNIHLAWCGHSAKAWQLNKLFKIAAKGVH